MKINRIQATNMEMTDAIRNYVEEKLAKLEGKLERFGEAASLEVEVGKTTHHHNKGEVFRCEIHVILPGKAIRVDETREDLYEAIVDARDKADRAIVDYKESLEDRQKVAPDA